MPFPSTTMSPREVDATFRSAAPVAAADGVGVALADGEELALSELPPSELPPDPLPEEAQPARARLTAASATASREIFLFMWILRSPHARGDRRGTTRRRRRFNGNSGIADVGLEQHVARPGGTHLHGRDVGDGDVDGADRVHGLVRPRLPAGDHRLLALLRRDREHVLPRWWAGVGALATVGAGHVHAGAPVLGHQLHV